MQPRHFCCVLRTSNKQLEIVPANLFYNLRTDSSNLAASIENVCLLCGFFTQDYTLFQYRFFFSFILVPGRSS